MGLSAFITDPFNRKRRAGVTAQNALKVAIVEQLAATLSPDELSVLSKRKQFVQLTTTSGGAYNMNVNGAGTPVEFALLASPDRLYYVNRLRAVIHGQSFRIDTTDFRRFGPTTAPATPLPNGILVEVQQSGITTTLGLGPITTTGDLVTLSDDQLNFQGAIDANIDYLHFDFNLTTPIVLVPGSTDKVSVLIRDDLTDPGLRLLTMICRGYQEIV